MTAPTRNEHRSRAAATRERLARRIEDGKLRPGERLPSEPDLAASMGISRATLREALRSLEEDGFVRRIQGAGTFITHRPRLKNNLDANFGVTDLIRSMGRRPDTVGLHVTRGSASPEEQELLNLAPRAGVVRVERIRTADREPVVFSIDVLPADLIPKSLPLERVGRASIYAMLEERCGVAVHQGVASIRPANADRDLAGKLSVPEGTLLLYLLQIDYDADGRPVLLSHEHHVADAFEITVVRRGPR
jgi:GntR family transcriptional regulator